MVQARFDWLQWMLVLATLASGQVRLDKEEQRRVIAAAISDVKRYYPDGRAAQRVANALSADDGASGLDKEAFARLLTKQIRDASENMHFELIYSPNPLPAQPRTPTAADQARYRQAMEENNCMFEKVEMLPHRIGYVKLNFFPDTSVCETKARAVMNSVNGADALIFDLRDNRGGFPEMVALIGSYLFDHPEYWYNPRENTTALSWTRSPVPGNQLANKPVFVLTSATTMSGAEQFCFNLKMLKRATLVGETTRGAAHAGVLHRIDEHFGIAIPEAQAINPYSKNDWEGTGVEPDMKINPADALEKAEALATRN